MFSSVTSWSRTEADATWLRDELRKRGYVVCFDRDVFDFDSVPDEHRKQTMIEEITSAVKRARAWIAFAAAWQPFDLPEGMNEAEAVRRGLAMDTGRGHLVKWSWQTLEIRNMGRYIVIGDKYTYIVETDSKRGEVIQIKTRDHMLVHVLAYLAGQRVLPSSTVGSPTISHTHGIV